MNPRTTWAVLCSLSLASAAAFATNDMNVDEHVELQISTSQRKSVSIQECQDASAQLASHGYCGQGGLACVTRLEAELLNSVEKTCVQAINDLKPIAP